ncbi:hypothetical protein [Streptomyces sp. NPDC055210]
MSEDRQEYERILDEALQSAPHRPEPAATDQRLNPAQLRTMALNATALITAAASTEYQHYIKVREKLRQSASPVRGASNLPVPDISGAGSTPNVREATEPTGAGASAIVAVLTPVLAGTAAAIFLLVGYILKMLDPEPGIARTLLTTGWLFGAVTAVSIVIAAVCLLLAALRNGSSSLQADTHSERSKEVIQAREAWHKALLERGIMPFLREALADPSTAVLTLTKPSAPASRIPQLGYNRPGFSSPDEGPAIGPRPSYSSPDFDHPDFGGPTESAPPTRSERAD